MNNNNEIWVFLSHSNKDYEKVRQVRNLLEEQSLRPLMFFLKCLNDDDELDDLIKREIKARTRFILCNSDNAQTSKWVQREVNFIKEGLHRVYQTINIDDPIEKLSDEILSFKKKLTVFISYSCKDQDYNDLLEERLAKLDYSVNTLSMSSDIGHDYTYCVKKNINAAVEKGFLIILISADSMSSSFFKTEIDYIKEIIVSRGHQANVLLFTIKDFGHGIEDDSLMASVGMNVTRFDNNCYNGIYRNMSSETIVDSIVQKLYESVMKDELPLLFQKGHPEGLYWKALVMWRDDHFDGASFGGFRKEAAQYAYEAMKKGHPMAKNLLQLMINEYPELCSIISE